jgi:hypothetical protein
MRHALLAAAGYMFHQQHTAGKLSFGAGVLPQANLQRMAVWGRI